MTFTRFLDSFSASEICPIVRPLDAIANASSDLVDRRDITTPFPLAGRDPVDAVVAVVAGLLEQRIAVAIRPGVRPLWPPCGPAPRPSPPRSTDGGAADALAALAHLRPGQQAEDNPVPGHGSPDIRSGAAASPRSPRSRW